VPRGAVTEEIIVVQLKTDHTNLDASNGTKNKFNEVFIDWNSIKGFDVEQLNADNTAHTDFKYLRNNHTG
jgi:hypothetical protein